MISKPKQEMPIINGSYGCTIETNKQETLEEIEQLAETLYPTDTMYTASLKEGFIKGVKWQAERMYSEEEVEKIARFGFNAGRRFELKAVELDFTFEKWFEQFKKK